MRPNHSHLNILTLNFELTFRDKTAGTLCDIHMLALWRVFAYTGCSKNIVIFI